MLASPTTIFDQTVTETVNGEAISPSLPEGQTTNSLAAILIVSASTITSMDVRIMHSPDGGTTWLELVDFTQVSGDGNELKQIATGASGGPFFGTLRVEVDTFTGTTARVQVIIQ